MQLNRREQYLYLLISRWSSFLLIAKCMFSSHIYSEFLTEIPQQKPCLSHCSVNFVLALVLFRY